MGHPRRTTAALAAAALALPVGLTSCAPALDGPSLVLTLATSETRQEANAPEIDMFAHEVDVRSAGTIRIDVAWDLTNPQPEGSDQDLARMVADGTYDLGVVPTRAWDVLGVTTLRAINTPFLITSDAAVRAVLAADVRDHLLAGLPSAGVTGIDLWPGQMRRLFGIGDPILRPADLAGQQIRSPRSTTVGDLLESMGATAVETADLDQNTQRGLESSFAAATYNVVATGNVVFFPRVETLVAHAELRARLEPGQWQVLTDAAAAVRREQPPSFIDDEGGARTFCEQGGEIVPTTAADVAAFEEAGRAVRAELAQDPETARLIDAIEAVVSTVTTPDPITACPEADTATEAADGADALDGVYQTTVTRQDLKAAGVTSLEQFSNNIGVFTWTFDDGSWSYHLESPLDLVDTDEAGQFTYEDGLFTLYWSSGEVITARADIARNGTVRFTHLQDNLEQYQDATEAVFGKAFRRVGDPPD